MRPQRDDRDAASRTRDDGVRAAERLLGHGDPITRRRQADGVAQVGAADPDREPSPDLAAVDGGAHEHRAHASCADRGGQRGDGRSDQQRVGTGHGGYLHRRGARGAERGGERDGVSSARVAVGHDDSRRLTQLGGRCEQFCGAGRGDRAGVLDEHEDLRHLWFS